MPGRNTGVCGGRPSRMAVSYNDSLNWNLGLAKVPGYDTRRILAKLIRASKNNLRQQKRPISRETIMANLYAYCIEQKVKYREKTPTIADWWDRISLYALDRTRSFYMRTENASNA